MFKHASVRENVRESHMQRVSFSRIMQPVAPKGPPNSYSNFSVCFLGAAEAGAGLLMQQLVNAKALACSSFPYENMIYFEKEE
jgi:hypothetical protein